MQTFTREFDQTTQNVHDTKVRIEHLVTTWAKYDDTQLNLELHDENKDPSYDIIQTKAQYYTRAKMEMLLESKHKGSTPFSIWG